MDTTFQDKSLTCRENNCQQPFLWTAGEQSFFAERQFSPPTRCKACRQRRKADQQGNTNTNVAAPPPVAYAPEVEVMPRRPPNGRNGGRRQRHQDDD